MEDFTSIQLQKISKRAQEQAVATIFPQLERAFLRLADAANCLGVITACKETTETGGIHNPLINDDDLDSVIIESLERYAKHHIPTGDFLRAVLENDLMEAIGRADDINKYRLHAICNYMYNQMPISCWGSKETVKDWLAKRKAGQ